MNWGPCNRDLRFSFCDSHCTEVLGAIDSVGLTTHPGFATIPLQVRVVEEATGIRCCESNATDTMDCVEAKQNKKCRQVGETRKRGERPL